MKKILLIAVIYLAVAGCSTQPMPRVFWPPPPGDTALEFIGAYYSEASFEKTPWEKFFDNFFGADSGEIFLRPTGIVSDGQGRVYVADQLLRNVRIFDFNKRHMHMLTKTAVLAQPAGLAIDSQKRLYVADGGAKKVAVFSPTDEYLFSFGSGELFQNPAYLALNERLGRIYVSDGKGHKIVVFDLQGKHLFSFGSGGDAPGLFLSPQGMAIDRDNRVYIADQFNARIQVFDADGTYVRHFGERGDGAGQMEMPKDLELDRDGNLYLLDTRKSSLTVYAPGGEPTLFLGGGRTWHSLGFANPTFIHIDENERIFITDMIARRFVVWQRLTPAYLQAHPITATDLQQLEGLKRDKDAKKAR